jgi:hypothetical protein
MQADKGRQKGSGDLLFPPLPILIAYNLIASFQVQLFIKSNGLIHIFAMEYITLMIKVDGFCLGSAVAAAIFH